MACIRLFTTFLFKPKFVTILTKPCHHQTTPTQNYPTNISKNQSDLDVFFSTKVYLYSFLTLQHPFPSEHLQPTSIFTSIITFRGKITSSHLYFYLYNRNHFISSLYFLLYLEISIFEKYISIINFFLYFTGKNKEIHQRWFQMLLS